YGHLPLPVNHRQINPTFFSRFDGFIIAGISMAHHAAARIVGEHTLQALTGLFRAVSYANHSGVYRITDTYAAAVGQRYPAGAAGCTKHGIQQRPARN